MEANISLKSSLLFSSLTSLKFTAYEKDENQRVRGGVKKVHCAWRQVYTVSYRTGSIILLSNFKNTLKNSKNLKGKKWLPSRCFPQCKQITLTSYVFPLKQQLCVGRWWWNRWIASVKSNHSSDTVIKELTKTETKYLNNCFSLSG